MSKILIVDDEPTIVELLEEHLQSEGYDTLHAYSGEEALQLLEGDVPDLVLLDLMLPGMDGYEVCRLMQRDSRLNHIPVIMLTARSAVPNKVLGYQRGADDYVVKPFDPDELTVRVRAQLHHLYHEQVSELTGLPGSQVVEDEIQRRSQTGTPFSIIYIDIEGFTVFNETYSFLEGDELVKATARALRDAIDEAGAPGDFLGHISGDQFAIITSSENVDGIKSAAEKLFLQSTSEFYSSTDRDQGYMVSVNRQGMLSRSKLCSLRFDVVNTGSEIEQT